MANHPTMSRTPLLELVQQRFGRRRSISREEMRDFLGFLEGRGLDLSAQGYAPYKKDLPSAWATLCDNCTTVSLIDDADPGAPASVNQGQIRYDQAGDMYHGFLVTLMFAPAALGDIGDSPCDVIGALREYCRRLLVVS